MNKKDIIKNLCVSKYGGTLDDWKKEYRQENEKEADDNKELAARKMEVIEADKPAGYITAESGQLCVYLGAVSFMFYAGNHNMETSEPWSYRKPTKEEVELYLMELVVLGGSVDPYEEDYFNDK